MKTLWKYLVLAKLEYCCQLCSRNRIQNIVVLGSTQRTFTIRIHGLQHLNYWDRLTHQKMYSLQWKRERYIIIYVWKVLKCRVPNLSIVTSPQPRRGYPRYHTKGENTDTQFLHSQWSPVVLLFIALPPGHQRRQPGNLQKKVA